jgi:hypothetical protein
LVRDQVIDGVLIPGGPFKCERTSYTPTDRFCFLIARIVIQKTGINYTITGRYLDITNDPNSYNPNTDVIIYKIITNVSLDITRSMDLGYSVSSNQASRRKYQFSTIDFDIGINSLFINSPSSSSKLRLPSTLEILDHVVSNNAGSPSSGGYSTTVYTPLDCEIVIYENDASVFEFNRTKSLKIPAKSTINFLLLCDYFDRYKWYII